MKRIVKIHLELTTPISGECLEQILHTVIRHGMHVVAPDMQLDDENTFVVDVTDDQATD